MNKIDLYIFISFAYEIKSPRTDELLYISFSKLIKLLRFTAATSNG